MVNEVFNQKGRPHFVIFYNCVGKIRSAALGICHYHVVGLFCLKIMET